jgi:hypothetical protein
MVRAHTISTTKISSTQASSTTTFSMAGVLSEKTTAHNPQSMKATSSTVKSTARASMSTVRITTTMVTGLLTKNKAKESIIMLKACTTATGRKI